MYPITFDFLFSSRNPAFFSTPNTRTDMYPSLGNLSISNARQEDHSSFPTFSAGRPVDLSTVTPSRAPDSYLSYSVGMSVTKSSPPKVSCLLCLTEWKISDKITLVSLSSFS